MADKTIRDILNDENKLNQVVRAAFDQVDTDRSGKIDKDELDKVIEIVCQDMGAQPPTHEETMEVFNHLDTDKSGKIEFNEFKTLIKDVLKSMLN
jgi:Ca2+-binding EF-hand superfamily protein